MLFRSRSYATMLEIKPDLLNAKKAENIPPLLSSTMIQENSDSPHAKVPTKLQLAVLKRQKTDLYPLLLKSKRTKEKYESDLSLHVRDRTWSLSRKFEELLHPTPTRKLDGLQRENTFQKAVTSGFFVKILRYKISLSTWTTFVNYRPHVAIRISWSQKDHQILSDGRRRIESSDL